MQDFEVSGLGRLFPNARFGSIQEWLDGHVAIHQPGCLWTRDAWQSCGPFRVDLQYVFDRYFFTRCRIKGMRLVSAGVRVAGFRLHEGSKTSRYQYTEDRFTPEWQRSRGDLERLLTPAQRASVWLARNLEENWRLVSEALEEENAGRRRPALLAKVFRNPLWMLHRPVAGALLRLSVRRFAMTGK